MANDAADQPYKKTAPGAFAITAYRSCRANSSGPTLFAPSKPAPTEAECVSSTYIAANALHGESFAKEVGSILNSRLQHRIEDGSAYQQRLDRIYNMAKIILWPLV